MKKLFLLLLAVCALTSCYVEHECPENKKIIDLQINSNEWEYSNIANNNFFSATFSIPEITPNIYNNGLVQVYREYSTGTSQAVQILLPQTRHNEVEVNGDWFFFTETVDYEYGVGTLTIFYTVSDFDYELNTSFVPESMHFRAVVQW